MSLFQSNLRKQIRKLPKILKFVRIIHYYSKLFTSLLSRSASSACPPASGRPASFAGSPASSTPRPPSSPRTCRSFQKEKKERKEGLAAESRRITWNQAKSGPDKAWIRVFAGPDYQNLQALPKPTSSAHILGCIEGDKDNLVQITILSSCLLSALPLLTKYIRFGLFGFPFQLVAKKLLRCKNFN